MSRAESYLADLEAVHAEHADVQVWSLDDAALEASIPRVWALMNKAQALFHELVAHADRRSLGDPHGFANTPSWLAAATRTTKPEARRTVKLAHRLDTEEHTQVQQAMSRGELSVDQAAVILKAVDDLPGDLVDPGLRELAEKDLVALAEHHDSRELRILGRRILEVRAPEIADQALARALETEEAHAEATSYFHLHPDGHGSMIGKFKIPLLAGRILEKHIEAIAAPKHQNAMAALDQTGARVPKPWRLGAAFTEYIQTRPADSVPHTGGIAATVVVTMTLETLLGSLKAGCLLDTGEAISAGQARQLCEQALIIPVVLGGESEILDIGRGRRLHTTAQRLAIAVRDKTCIVEGCERTITHAHFHHLDPWSQGGHTSVERGVMICPPHHTQIHNPRYTTENRPHGKIRFHRRT